MAKRQRGPTETFSVSVDRRTKRVLKAHADRLFGGNMSKMIAAFGREAEKRDALHWLVEDAGGSSLTDAKRAELAAEFYGLELPRKRRRSAA
jgi:hypothetical protein